MSFDTCENTVLFEKYRSGDINARDEIVRKNIPLVKSIVHRLSTPCESYDDLLQTGTVGLLKAIDGYDLNLGYAFSTYAFTLITGEIKRYLRDNSVIKVSRVLKKNAAFVLSQREKYIRLHGKEPSLTVLSSLCGLSPEDITQCLEACSSVRSIDECISEHDDRSIGETLSAEDEISPLIDSLALHQALTLLEGQDKQLIILRFFKGFTQMQTAKILGISQVTVSRMEKRILKALREQLV